MINEKIAELYRQQQPQQPQQALKWYHDPFVKKVIIFVCAMLAISTIAGIVFVYMEYSTVQGIASQVRIK